jgi:eukaryotic-like serine/threonine-protein kinase
MNPQRWQQIDRLVASALECDPAERAAFLTEACRGDDELRMEVESLLANDLSQSFGDVVGADEDTRLLAKLPTGDSRVIGPYKIVRSLGIGGMGHVYLGRDERLNRFVAVKVLSDYHADEAEKSRRFRREALAVSALNHPNILTVYEIGSFAGNEFIATEFVDGRTLSEIIKNDNLSLHRKLDIVIQIASALAAAHSAGIIHRDIKPANIMVRADGLVKVLDFGIAKYSELRESITPESFLETTPGTVVGTAAYMSPEQARGLPTDARTDIWSLGVIIYELVCGHRPFDGDTTLDVMSAVIERQPQKLSDVDGAVPEDLETLVLKALNKDKNERYQNAEQLLADLKILQKSVEVSAEQTPTVPQQSAPVGSGAASGVLTDRLPDRPSTIDRPVAETLRRLTTYKRVGLVAALLAIIIAAGSYFYFRKAGGKTIESIAVMPFSNESGNNDIEYLSDGMTDSLINSLSQLPNLSVKARTSVFRYKGKEADPQRVGTDLSVQAVLNGRVVQHENDLTLYLSLVDTSNGNQIWGDRYDRKMTQLVTLQSEIARDVSQKLRVRLSGTEEKKLTKDYTANVEAYQLYLRGRFHMFKLTPEEINEGIGDFQKAIDLDPNYALAYVGLSDANRTLVMSTEKVPKEYLPRSKIAAQKALEIDDSLAEAHTALGITLFWNDWNWNESENQFRRAIELNPKEQGAHLFYAHLLSNTGRHSEALTEIRRAIELDPFAPFANALYGQFLVAAGQPDEALAVLQKTFLLAPRFWFPHVFAASAYIEKGMFTEAIAETRRATELSGAQTSSLAFEGYALAKLGKRDEARAIAKKLELLSKERFIPPTHIAYVYNGLGETEEALVWLERALEQHDPKLTFMKVDAKWNNLRDDPRFRDFMHRIGF